MSKKIWSAEIVISATKALHEQGSKINTSFIQKNHRRLYCAGRRYIGEWPAVLEAAGLSNVVPKRNVWNKEVILARIADLIAGEEPLNNAYIKKNHSILYTVSCQYFGSWKTAVEAAGIDYEAHRLVPLGRKWSKEAIAAEIRLRHKMGKSIRGAVVHREDSGLYESALLHFGNPGWQNARIAAGFPPTDPKEGVIYDKQLVIDGLRRLYDEGHDINVAAFIGSKNVNLMTAGVRLFGSHDKALAAAGFDPEKIRKQRRWTKAKVLREIRKLERAGARLNWWTIGQTHKALCGAAVRLFGTWGQAVEAAGINYRKHLRQWSSKTFLRQLSQEDYENTINSRVTRKKRSRKT